MQASDFHVIYTRFPEEKVCVTLVGPGGPHIRRVQIALSSRWIGWPASPKGSGIGIVQAQSSGASGMTG